MYSVELSAEARQFYDRCDKPIAKKLARCFYTIDDQTQRVYVIAIAKRSDVYE